MGGRRRRVREVAELVGVSVRTLHHYDEIGLLVPAGRSDTGYRLYDDADLLRLQQILIYRELGLPLEEIRQLLDDPEADRKKTLLAQREALDRRARATRAMLRSVDAALAALKGEGKMEKIFDPAEYEAEARERWGETDSYREAARRTRSYTSEDWRRIHSESRALMEAFAERMRAGSAPADEDVRALAEAHRRHIDRWYYPCSPFRHAALAGLYLADERFSAVFEAHGAGLAEFVASAIRANRL